MLSIAIGEAHLDTEYQSIVFSESGSGLANLSLDWSSGKP